MKITILPCYDHFHHHFIIICLSFLYRFLKNYHLFIILLSWYFIMFIVSWKIIMSLSFALIIFSFPGKLSFLYHVFIMFYCFLENYFVFIIFYRFLENYHFFIMLLSCFIVSWKKYHVFIIFSSFHSHCLIISRKRITKMINK